MSRSQRTGKRRALAQWADKSKRQEHSGERWGAWVGRGPGEACGEVGTGDGRQGWAVLFREDRQGQAGVERRTHAAADRTQRTAEGFGQRRQLFFAGIGGQRRLSRRVDCTELAADAVELHADHLPVTDAASEHVEQDAAIEHPGQQ